MPLPKGRNPNRPKPGSSIKVEPIRTKTAIENIKKILRDNPRNADGHPSLAATAASPAPSGCLP
jgi:hypothetical protein